MTHRKYKGVQRPMKVTRHGEHLIQLTRYPLLFPVSVYFVVEEDGLTLVDTGMSGSAADIRAAAEKLGIPIRRIALTHAHGDHAGSLDELHELLPDAEVLVSERDARFLAGDQSLDPGEPQAKLRGSYITRETRPTRLLSAGDRVGSLEVIATPGHTPGHLAFFDTRERTLIAGDAFQTRGGVAVSGTLRPFFPFPALATWHKPLALASARILHGLSPSRLAVGHGRVIEDPLTVMERAIATAERSLGMDVASAA